MLWTPFVHRMHVLRVRLVTYLKWKLRKTNDLSRATTAKNKMITLLSRKCLASVIVTMAVALLSCTRHSPSLEASLYVAACDGDITKTRELLRRGANINA